MFRRMFQPNSGILMSHSMRRQLVTRLLLGSLLLCVAAGTGVYAYLRDETIEQWDASLLSNARSLAGLVHMRSDGRLGFEFSERTMPEFRRGAESSQYFVIQLENGSIFARSPSLEGMELPLPEPTSNTKGFYDLTMNNGRDARAVWLRFQGINTTTDTNGSAFQSDGDKGGVTGEARPRLMLILASDRRELDETLRHVMIALLIMAIALSAGTTAVVVGVVRHGFQPLQTMADAASRIDANNLAYRFDIQILPTELAAIGQRLNDLLDRLDRAFQRERRFTADVAHELRTPIAELRTLAEVAVKWPPDQGQADRNFRSIVDIARQMEVVVTSLLALMRCQSSSVAAAREAVSVRDVVLEAWRRHADMSQARLLERIEVAPDLIVEADKVMLLSLFGNLFSNAVSYTPQGGRVYCRAEMTERTVIVTVSNTNPGLNDNDVTHLSEPFWRKDQARGDHQHVGLGLALVKAYSDAQGIDVRFALAENGLFEVRLTMKSFPPPVETYKESHGEDGLHSQIRSAPLAGTQSE